MLNRAKKIFEIVNRKISLGAGNVLQVPESKEVLKSRDNIVDYYRYLYMQLIVPLKDINPHEFNLYMTFLLALFGEIYKTGNCSEYTFLSTVEFLKQGKESNLAVVCIDDKSKDTNHGLLFANYPENINLDDTSTYVNFLLFDTWPAHVKVKQYDDKIKYSIDDLVNPETENIDKVSFAVQFPGDLPLNDWISVSNFFFSQKAKLNQQAVENAIRESNVTGIHSKKELKMLEYSFFKAGQEYGDIADKHRKVAKSLSVKIDRKASEATLKELKRISHNPEWKYNQTYSNFIFASTDIVQVRLMNEHFFSAGIKCRIISTSEVYQLQIPIQAALSKLPDLSEIPIDQPKYKNH